MPIFMDRHYVEGASRHTVETAHKQDIEIQGDFDVNIMTYWFDEARSTTFCLAEAPMRKRFGTSMPMPMASCPTR